MYVHKDIYNIIHICKHRSSFQTTTDPDNKMTEIYSNHFQKHKQGNIVRLIIYKRIQIINPHCKYMTFIINIYITTYQIKFDACNNVLLHTLTMY